MSRLKNKLAELRFDMLAETVENLISSNGSTTSLDVKNRLRETFGELNWNQRWVSKMMRSLTFVMKGLDWKENKNNCDVYSLKKNTKSNTVRISKTKAVQKIMNSGGRFGSFTFATKNNPERKLVGRFHSADKLGYLKMIEISTGEYRNMNTRTLKNMKLDGKQYKIA